MNLITVATPIKYHIMNAGGVDVVEPITDTVVKAGAGAVIGLSSNLEKEQLTAFVGLMNSVVDARLTLNSIC